MRSTTTLAAVALALGGASACSPAESEDLRTDARPRADGAGGSDAALATPPQVFGVSAPATVPVEGEAPLAASLGTKAGTRLDVRWTVSAGTITPTALEITADETGNATVAAVYTAPTVLGPVELTLTVEDDRGGQVTATRSISVERAAAYTLGVTTSWPDDPAAFAYTGNRLLAQAIVVPAEVELQGLGVIANRAGPQMRTALFTDAGGTPSLLVATGATVTLVRGANIAPVAPTVLPPGTYWLGTLFDRDANLAEDTPRRDEPRRYVLFGFLQPWMASFPSPLSSMGPTASFFLVVQDPAPPP